MLSEKWIKRVYEYKWYLSKFNKLCLTLGRTFVRKGVDNIGGRGHGSLERFFGPKSSILILKCEYKMFQLDKTIGSSKLLFNYKVKKDPHSGPQ